MNKTLLLVAAVFFMNMVSISAQDLIWTGASSNNDFFDEGNWRDSTTNLPPNVGAINSGVAINLQLRISNITTIVRANGEINLGSGSLSLTECNLISQSFSGAGGTVTMNEGAYVELTDAVPFKTTTPRVLINFTSGLAWVKIINVTARNIQISFLSFIRVNGANATYRTNLRLDNYYFNGCVIRTNQASTTPLIVYDSTNLQGMPIAVPVNTIHRAETIPGGMNDKIESFLLKKGFMVTVADESDGTGKSKNYIASESDLIINDFPKVLQNSISFIRVMPWNWVTKKGFNSTINADVNGSWRYSWNGNESSSTSWEFGPMSWGQGTADSDEDILKFVNLYNTTHLMSFNEPDDCEGQSGQYGNPKLCVEDEAVKWHKNLMKTGMRMVSPAGREEAPFGWLKRFYDKAKAADARIDVIAVHWYDWGNNPTVNTNPTALQVFNRFKAYLTNVHNLYGLPIWITEFNANPARSQAINAGFLELALPYLESLDYIERYCWFPFNTGTHFTTGWNDTTGTQTNNTLSLVGTIYKNINNITPVNSSPSIPEATVNAANNLDLLQFPNVALNKLATANTSVSASFLPQLAVDGNSTSTSSLWVANIGNTSSANLTPLPAWFEVDLQGSYTIDSFRISETGSAVRDFNFQVWDTTLNSGAGGWRNAINVTGNTATSLITFRTMDPVTTTKVRLFITAHNSTSLIRIFELEVYGKVASNLGVATFTDSQPFSIYPNPISSGILNISGDQVIESVDVFSVLGAKLSTRFTNGQLEVSNLAAGVYFLKVNNKYSFKFIKK